MSTISEMTTKQAPTWCPGCGDFTILASVKNALVEIGVERENTLIVSGIGCGSKLPHFVNVYGFEGLHGRALPVAMGAKLANPDLNVIVIA
ncbi:MAG TPA: thiamine pyrophosphate-dependent enzyme, partial [archaeon]|nr:thiamine pyrophosphate-dependent enzyme [archaeon]